MWSYPAPNFAIDWNDSTEAFIFFEALETEWILLSKYVFFPYYTALGFVE